MRKGSELQVFTPEFPYAQRRRPSKVVEFSKFRFFLLLHVIFATPYLFYQAVWIFSDTTIATYHVYKDPKYTHSSHASGTIIYQYQIGEYRYTETATRNGLSEFQSNIEIQFLPFAPAISRVNSFEGKWMGFLIAWGIFLVVSGIIFFTPNETMPKNSFFQFTRRKPFIDMIVK